MIGRRRMRARLAGALAALSAAALLAGCVMIPTSGEVLSVPIEEDQAEEQVTFLPRGPQAGATQEEILQGFVTAGLGPQDGYQVAKQFLAPEFATDWNPTESVLVSSRREPVVRLGAERLELGVQVDAVVDAAGVYRSSRGGGVQDLEFEFEEVDGEWRISGAPDGTVVSAGTFRTLFEPYPLYFVDPSAAFLVPDVRWYPRLATSGTRMARSLIQGPSAWLEGAVTTSFPEGTRLASPVQIEDGVARVELSPEALEAGQAGRSRMLSQLRETLGALGTVSGVELVVRDLPIDVAAGEPLEAEPRAEADPLVLGEDGFGFAGDDGLRRIAGVSAVVEELEPDAVVLSRDRASAAIRTEAGVSLVRDGEAAPVDERPDLVAPSIDPHGWLWSASRTGDRTLRLVDGSGAVVELDSGLPDRGVLTALRVSRDGSRLLAAVRGADSSVLLAAAIIRDADLVPVEIGEAVTVATESAAIVDAAWVSGDSVASLTQDAGGAHVRITQLGGFTSGFGEETAAGAIAAGEGGSTGIRLLEGDRVLQPSGAGGWRAVERGVRVLGVQQ
ncbi:LpqB family beta-propeller domain-containing protein [Homoserinibacter sp. YIM 151385]|uniref:LpqB family beta-propeller domain-containing protein n=1 Tax=Homoserinibacter sp. YIM 151385 TaxID=2985506 RepID=UPI0022F133D1|nr:LpqB family beta-propeller domain-containing protein [Homoserinibacter sp. YIM 151385]WBU37813.1 LpqB family beta-propeller domain-containing protein [Homoserinibacter sp. YIM 151385]